MPGAGARRAAGFAEEIGDYAFDNCVRLRLDALPAGLLRIGAWAFQWCEALETLACPEHMESIGDGAFAHSGLRRIRMPARTARLGRVLIMDCQQLEDAPVG